MAQIARKAIILNLIVGLFVLGFSGFAQGSVEGKLANRSEGRKGKGEGKIFQRLLSPEGRQKLGITDDQAKKIEDLHVSTAKQMIDLNAKIKTTKIDLEQALKEKRPDKVKVLGLIEATGKLKTDEAKLRMVARLNLREILTDQQIDTIQKMRQERGQKMGPMPMRRGGRGMMGGPNMGPMQQQMQQWRQQMRQMRPDGPAAAPQPMQRI